MRLADITKRFGGHTVYEGLNLSFDTEITAILGRSGCGKTTLLNLIAGVVKPDAGAITGQGVVSYVFQTPRLIPHLTARANLTYVGIDREKAGETLALCGVDPGLYPRQLSGGMAQRVGLARAFACPADTVLMDEPFKSLDLGLKKRLIDLTARLYSSGRAVLLVTHDPDEAERLAERAVVIEQGGAVYDERKKNGRFEGLKELLEAL